MGIKHISEDVWCRAIEDGDIVICSETSTVEGKIWILREELPGLIEFLQAAQQRLALDPAMPEGDSPTNETPGK